MRKTPRASMIILLTLASFGFRAFADENSAAEIVSIQGSGQFKQQDRQDWRDARVEQQLIAGNLVRTGEYSRMGLLFRDRTQIRLNEKTLLRIKQARLPSRDDGKTLLRLDRGRAWSQTRTIPEGLVIETPSATAAVRGTRWELSVDDSGASTLTVLNGEVEFFNDFGRVTVAADEQARAAPGRAPVKIRLVDSATRVQWVSAFEIDPSRHIRMHSDSVGILNRDLAGVTDTGAAGLAVLGSILADLGRRDQARARFEAALASQPENARANLGLGLLALAEGRLDEASLFFERVAPDAESNERELLVLGRASLDLLSGSIRRGLESLDSLIADGRPTQAAAFLIRSEIALFDGDTAAAVEHVEAGLRLFPRSASLTAQLARVFLFSDRIDNARQAARLAFETDDTSIDAGLVSGDVASLSGEASQATGYYRRAATLTPEEDRAWYGLGRVDTEREAVRGGRENLRRALQLNADGAGYHGQLGTLETFANDFDAAASAFDDALRVNPDDYVALTGKGILDLKRGDADNALDFLLKAELLEPRYARAQVYKAIAYYQLGRVDEALDALRQASRLDQRDPMPHIVSSVIYTDLQRADDAVDAARKGLELMPYLKSLNQLANDQQGAANLGKSFAFLGLDEWSRSYAQQSYHPYWAGSHLFLADVGYDGLYTKNSELFQGFLLDPTLFGASPRSQSVIPKPGNHAVASMRVSQSEDFSGSSPLLSVNGFANRSVPLAYHLSYENFDLDFEGEPFDLDSYTGAFGLSPGHALGLFVFADRQTLYSEIDERREDASSVTDIDLADDLTANRLDLGMHYKFSPSSQLWVKAGRFDSEDFVVGSLVNTEGATVVGGDARSDVVVDQPEFALRHSFQFNSRHQVSLGFEYADRSTDSFFSNQARPGVGAFTVESDFSERSTDWYLSDNFRVNDLLSLQADIYYVDHEREVRYIENLSVPPFPPLPETVTDQRFEHDGLFPRLGLVYRLSRDLLLRVAYQHWARPAGFSSLAQVATAGIPLDDRLVMRGGELKRLRGQLEWELSASTFAQAFLDLKEIDNDLFEVTPFTVNELEGLAKLRQRDLGSLIRGDLLEFVNTPEYEGADIFSAGFALNHRLGRGVGLLGRYQYADSENNGDAHAGKQAPMLAEHSAALGATWVRADGWHLVGRMVYRSERHSDEANRQALDASWDGAFDLFRETADKHWLLRFSVDELLDENEHTQYTAELSARF